MRFRSAAGLIALCVVGWVRAATLAGPAAYATELASLVNDYRATRHTARLTVDPALSDLALEHSAAMVRAKRLGHDDFKARFGRSGYGMCVENVGWNYSTPQAQLLAWRQSPGHDRNLLDARVAHMGIGTAADYVTFICCR